MYPMSTLPPSGDFTKRLRPIVRATGTVAAYAGVVATVLAIPVIPTHPVALILMLLLIGWPVGVAMAPRRSFVVTGIAVGGLCWGIGLLNVGSIGTVPVLGLFLVWAAAALASFALLDAETTADHKPLGVTSERAADGENSERLSLVGMVVAGLFAALLLALLLPLIPRPNFGGGGGEEQSQGGDGDSGDGRSGQSDGDGRSGGGGSPNPWAQDGPWIRVERHEWFTRYDPGPASSGPDIELLRLQGPPVERVRGITLDRFEDGAWFRSALPSTIGADLSPQPVQLPQALSPNAGPVETWTLTVAYSGIEQLVAPGEPISIATADDTQRPGQVYIAADGSALFSPPLVEGTQLVIEGVLDDTSPNELGLVPVGRPAPEGLDYLRPGDLNRVGERAAADVAGTASTVFGRQQNTETFLEQNTCRTRYETTSVEREDPVNTYLDGTPGTTEEVNSAAALILRQAGVPTRFASGFLVDQPDAITGEQSVYLSGGTSWVEVWYGPDQGWQAWDASVDVPLCPPAQDPAPPTTQPPPPPKPPRNLSLPRWVVPAILVVLLAGLVFWWWRRRRARQAELDARPWTQKVMAGIYDEAGPRGRSRRSSQTLVDYTNKVGGSVLPEPELVEVGVAVGRELYSPYPPDPAQRERAEELVARAVAAAEAREKAERQAARAARRAKANPANWRRRASKTDSESDSAS